MASIFGLLTTIVSYGGYIAESLGRIIDWWQQEEVQSNYAKIRNIFNKFIEWFKKNPKEKSGKKDERSDKIEKNDLREESEESDSVNEIIEKIFLEASENESQFEDPYGNKYEIECAKNLRVQKNKDINNVTPNELLEFSGQKKEIIILSGGNGSGKTVYCKKLAEICQNGENLVITIKIRKGEDLSERSIFADFLADQLCVSKNITSEEILKYVEENESKIFIIVDGLDYFDFEKNLSKSILNEATAKTWINLILCRRVLKESKLIIACNFLTLKKLKDVNSNVVEYKILDLDEELRKSLIELYNENDSIEIVDYIEKHSIQKLTTSPFNLSLLCLFLKSNFTEIKDLKTLMDLYLGAFEEYQNHREKEGANVEKINKAWYKLLLRGRYFMRESDLGNIDLSLDDIAKHCMVDVTPGRKSLQKNLDVITTKHDIVQHFYASHYMWNYLELEEFKKRVSEMFDFKHCNLWSKARNFLVGLCNRNYEKLEENQKQKQTILLKKLWDCCKDISELGEFTLKTSSAESKYLRFCLNKLNDYEEVIDFLILDMKEIREQKLKKLMRDTSKLIKFKLQVNFLSSKENSYETIEKVKTLINLFGGEITDLCVLCTPSSEYFEKFAQVFTKKKIGKVTIDIRTQKKKLTDTYQNGVKKFMSLTKDELEFKVGLNIPSSKLEQIQELKKLERFTDIEKLLQEISSQNPLPSIKLCKYFHTTGRDPDKEVVTYLEEGKWVDENHEENEQLSKEE